MLNAQCSRKRASKDRFKNKLAGENKIATPLTEGSDQTGWHLGRVKDNRKRGVHGVKFSDMSSQIEMGSR
jgi:hypothetical protein